MEIQSSTLYVVPTPIGNLADITHRSIHVLSQVELILCEDTRVSQKLLKHYNIDTPTKSYHMHNEHRTVDRLVEQLQQGMSMALISDAGTPAISDPGFLLVRACLQSGVNVTSLPGPTAFVPALVQSGFPTDRFVFEGFLPHKKGRETRLKNIMDMDCTIIYYESPHRILKTLTQMLKIFENDRKACVVREISKIYETYHHGSLSSLIEYFKETKPKGEIVLLISGKD